MAAAVAFGPKKRLVRLPPSRSVQGNKFQRPPQTTPPCDDLISAYCPPAPANSPCILAALALNARARPEKKRSEALRVKHGRAADRPEGGTYQFAGNHRGRRVFGRDCFLSSDWTPRANSMIIHWRGRVAAGRGRRGRGRGRYANAKEIDDRGSWIRGSIDRRGISLRGYRQGGGRDTTMILLNRAPLVAG